MPGKVDPNVRAISPLSVLIVAVEATKNGLALNFGRTYHSTSLFCAACSGEKLQIGERNSPGKVGKLYSQQPNLEDDEELLAAQGLH